MLDLTIIKKEFQKYGGILKTSELNKFGLSSRQIKKLLDSGVITKVKLGYYELSNNLTSDEVLIARIFPNAVIYLESALMHYGYTDRIPSAIQVAVDKDSAKSKYNVEYPLINPFYIETKFMNVGVSIITVEGINVKIYDRDRTICDVLRYENKLEKEVFNNAIQNYLKDNKKNIRNLLAYADILGLKGKVKTYIGVWL